MAKKTYTFLSGDQEYYVDDERFYSFNTSLSECTLLHVVSKETELAILISPHGKGYLDFGRNPDFIEFLKERKVIVADYTCETIEIVNESKINLVTNGLSLRTIEIRYFRDGYFLSIHKGQYYDPIKEYAIPDGNINFQQIASKQLQLIEEKEYEDEENLPDKFHQAASKSKGCLVLILALTSAVLLAVNLI